MKQFLLKLWQDEAGAETAEWLVIVAILVVVGITVYNTDLLVALQGMVAHISALVAGLPGLPA